MSAKQVNPVLTLKERLQRRFPGASVAVDAPSRADGVWFLDVKLKDHSLALQWSPQRGFGVSAGRAATFGEGPDELYKSAARAYERAVALLLSRGSTVLPRTARLDELRKLVGLSQVELAESLAVGQPVVSKRERCLDMMLSTLRTTVEAMGGILDVRVVFKDGAVRLELPGPAASGPRTRVRGTSTAAGRRKS